MKVKFLNSIRFEIFLAITVLVVLFVIAGLGFSTFFLDDYYESMKKDSLIESSVYLKELYNTNQNDFYEAVEKESDKLGALYLIYNYDEDSIVANPIVESGRGTGNGRSNLSGSGMAMNFVSFAYHDFDVVKSVGYELIEKTQEKLNTIFFSIAFILDDSHLMILSVPKTAIEDSVMIAKRFFLFLSGILFLVGALMSLFISRKFSNPIIRLNYAVNEMTNLNFDSYYKEDRKDEIGKLGRSFNQLSLKLSSTISQLNNANERLKEDISIVEKNDKMRGEFISSASHELKTPVSIIQGYAAGLKEIDGEEKRNEYIDIIFKESERMDQIIKNLLNLSELENSQIQLNMKRFDLANLADEMMYTFNQMFNDKKVKVVINNLVTAHVYADQERIEHLLRNYISNALHHVKGSMKIQVDIIELESTFQFRIFNTGDSIPENKLNEIWGAFYKVDRARSREYGGTGLGLAIVKRICESHKFDYGVENQKDGIVFWVNIDKG